MSTDKFGSGMHYHICSMLDGSDEIRRSEGIINHYRKAMLVSYLCNGVDVRDVAVGVSESLKINGSRILFDGILYFPEVMSVHEGGPDAVLRKSMCQKIVASAVNGLLGYDVAAVGGKRLYHVSDGGCPGRQGEGSRAALKGGQALLQHILGGVGQSTVNISCICQTETVGSMLTVMKNV